MIKACVIGHPIKHSKSPKIHSYWFGKNKLNGEYHRFDVKPEELEEKVQWLKSEDFKGFNVTIPHKEAMIELCDIVDDTAEKIGAVNTVLIKDNKLIGFNTDAYGFTKNIKAVHKNFSFKQKTVLVLGAGGASKAVLYGLIDRGIEKIYLTNRTKKKATAIAKQFGKKITVVNWKDKEDVLHEINLLVNTTSLGMEGQKPLEISLDTLSKEAIVNDIVYSPLMTPLLTEAKTHGNPYVTGIGMLLYQAQPAFKLWTNILPEVDEGLIKRMMT